MLLREFLRKGSFDFCSAKITIEDAKRCYCDEEEYDYVSEVNIEEHYDASDNLIEINSIVLEPWWVNVMDRRIDNFMINYDSDSNCIVMKIMLIDDDEPDYIDDFRSDTEKPAYKILDHLSDLEDDQEVLDICKTSGIDHLEELSAYVYPQYLEGKTDKEKLSIITQVMEESYRWNMEKLRKYYLVYGNYREYLIADCEDDEEKEKIQEWLNRESGVQC